jgi:hypothetical protein
MTKTLLLFSLVFSNSNDAFTSDSKAIDLGSSTVESSIRQPPTQITENPNQISIMAKEVLTEDFFEFEKQTLEALRNNK